MIYFNWPIMNTVVEPVTDTGLTSTLLASFLRKLRTKTTEKAEITAQSAQATHQSNNDCFSLASVHLYNVCSSEARQISLKTIINAQEIETPHTSEKLHHNSEHDL